MVLKFWKVSLVFATLLCGCGGGDNTVTPVVNPNDPTVRSVPRLYQGLEFVLSVPKKTYAVGEEVVFTTTIRNTTHLPISVTLATIAPRDAAMVAIRDTADTLIDYAPEVTFPGAVFATFLPGTTTSYDSTWTQVNGHTSQQVPTGDYGANMRLAISELNGQPPIPADRDGLGSDTIHFTIQ